MLAGATPTRGPRRSTVSAFTTPEPADTHTEAVEAFLIGGLLKGPAAWPVVSDIVSETDFHTDRHRLIFAGIRKLANQGTPATIVTLPDCLEQDGLLQEVGGTPYLAATELNTASAANITHHAKVLKRRALDRQIKAAAAAADYSALQQRLDDLKRLEQTPAAIDIREQYGIKSLAEILRTEYPEPRWAIPGILPEGLTLLAGPPKVKKSWLALGAAIAINTGGKALGRIDVEQGRVLYLALEDRERRLQRRARAILADNATSPDTLDIATTWRRLDAGGHDALRDYLTKHPDTRLVIVDTLARVRPRKQRGQSDYDADYHAVRLLKELADEFSTSILVITHTRKQTAEDFLDAVIGTHGCTGAADGLLVLRRARCSDTGILSITGRDIENERESVLRWDKRTCTWNLTDANPAEINLTPERRRVVEILRASPTPLSGKQIATALHGREMTGKNDNDWKVTRNLLGRMVTSGIIQQLEDKSYALPASGPPDVDENTYAPYAPDALNAPYVPYAPEQSGSGAPEQSGSGAQGACLGAYAPDTGATDCENQRFSEGAQSAQDAYIDSADLRLLHEMAVEPVEPNIEAGGSTGSTGSTDVSENSSIPPDYSDDPNYWKSIVTRQPPEQWEGRP